MRGARLAAVVATFLVTAACSTAQDGSTTLLVSAAASLTEAFEAIEMAFEAVHPEVDVQLNVGGSPALVAQVLEGAPVDVLALASEDAMARVTSEGLAAGATVVFARNAPAIAVPVGNPGGVEGLDSFGDPDLLLGLCAESVPCGQLAHRVLADAGISPSLDTVEADVRSLLARIEVGELDAGIVYVTDVRARARAVEAFPIDTTLTTTYTLVRIADAPNPTKADEFLGFVLSEEGQKILASAGFLSP